jgi:hypothetical protein
MEVKSSLSGALYAQNNIGQSTSEAKPTSVPLQDRSNFNSELILLPTALMAIAGMVAVILGLNIKKSLHNRLSSMQRVKKMPCANCCYFKNNPYLKCAVQPDRVLTKEAHHCPDYEEFS